MTTPALVSKVPLRLLFWAIFAIGFHHFFYSEKLALNLVLFGSLTGAVSLWLESGAWSRTPVRITAGGTLLTGLFVLLYASTVARWGFCLSYMTFLGFVYAPALRSLPVAVVGSLLGPGLGLFHFADQVFSRLSQPRTRPRKRWAQKWARYAVVSVVPLVLVVVFAWLFGLANQHFGELVDVTFGRIGDVVEWMVGAMSIERFVMLLLGGFFATLIFIRSKHRWLEKWDAQAASQLVRRRRQRARRFKMLALRREYLVAVLAMAAVNALTLLQNGLDLNYVWLNFSATSSTNLTQFVHEGTYVLIASILLAMAIMFYFFRGNLNFLANNRWLRRLAYLWIGQNLFMVASVAVRNYHYIQHCGLAYKRIGVFFFLALVAFGLATLFLKIQRRKTIHEVVRVNGWATYAVLIALTFFNWDLVIARYNLQYTPNDLDTEYLVAMSDKALPLLWEHRELLEANRRDAHLGYSGEEVESFLEGRIRNFRWKMENRSWLSWNLGDARAKSYFEDQTQWTDEYR